MSYNNHLHSGPALHVGRLPWLIFLFLAAVFFFVDHDLSSAKRGIDNYGQSADDYIALVNEGPLTRRIALLSLGLFAIVSLVGRRTNVRLRINGPLGWILLSFTAWAFLSSIWAEDMPLTLRRLGVFGILCIAAVAVARRLSLRQIILWTFFSTTVFLVIGFIAEVHFGTFQPFATGYRFAGTLHPNGEGIGCALLTLSAVAAADAEKRWRPLFWACALLGFVFLILTASRSAFAAILPALAAYFAAVSSRRAKTALGLGLCLVIGVCLFLLVRWDPPYSALRRAALLGRDDSSVGSINGRIGVWEDVGYYIARRPLLGYGYGGFWTPTHIRVISDEEKWGVPESHSAYLDYLLTLGAVGLGAYTLLLIAGIRRAFQFQKVSRNSAFAFCGGLLVFCGFVGFLQSGAAVSSFPMFLTVVVLAQLAFVSRPKTTRIVNRYGRSILLEERCASGASVIESGPEARVITSGLPRDIKVMY